MLTPTEKRCRDCNEVKLATGFHVCSSRKDGLMPYCKACQSRRGTDYYAAHREEIKAKAKAAYEVERKAHEGVRMLVIEHYGGECACCGERRPEFMAVDHIDGGGTEHKRVLGKRGRRFYRWIVENDFPDYLRILCHNCNQARGAYGYCPHEREGLTEAVI